MRYTVSEIAGLVGGEVRGDGRTTVSGIASLEAAKPEHIAFVTPKSLEHAARTRAGALIASQPVEGFHGPQIIVKGDPYLAFLPLMQAVEREYQHFPKGIHPTAVVEDGAQIGEGVALGPCVVICAGAQIGPRTVLSAHAYVGAESVLGADCLVYPNVTIRERVRIGDRAIIHPGTVIGGDGFGFRPVGGKHVKVPQVGTVQIGDDVEVGCNCTIDRATMDTTVIGNGVKMDNHCHIAHNCQIGDNSILVAYARIGGGTVLGKNVTLAEDVGVTDHVRIGDGCVVAGTGKVSKDLPPGAVVWGSPAQDIRREMRERAACRKAPEMWEDLRKLKHDVERLKGQQRG
jgi:UDP-3-O-[3-hydroxymyristoyl] glucosamine N-acyltransferase